MSASRRRPLSYISWANRCEQSDPRRSNANRSPSFMADHECRHSRGDQRSDVRCQLRVSAERRVQDITEWDERVGVELRDAISQKNRGD